MAQYYAPEPGVEHHVLDKGLPGFPLHLANQIFVLTFTFPH